VPTAHAKFVLFARNESIDGEGARVEEVEITRSPVDVPPDNECRASGQREVLCLSQFSNDVRDPILQRAQHSRSVSRATAEPFRPRSADIGGQNQLIEVARQLIDVDVVAHVVLGPLAQHLFVYAQPVGVPA